MEANRSNTIMKRFYRGNNIRYDLQLNKNESWKSVAKIHLFADLFLRIKKKNEENCGLKNINLRAFALATCLILWAPSTYTTYAKEGWLQIHLGTIDLFLKL